jgi:hypothetical protein
VIEYHYQVESSVREFRRHWIPQRGIVRSPALGVRRSRMRDRVNCRRTNATLKVVASPIPDKASLHATVERQRLQRWIPLATIPGLARCPASIVKTPSIPKSGNISCEPVRPACIDVRSGSLTFAFAFDPSVSISKPRAISHPPRKTCHALDRQES